MRPKITIAAMNKNTRFGSSLGMNVSGGSGSPTCVQTY